MILMTIILHMGLLVIFTSLLTKKGFPNKGEDILFVSLIVFAPIFSLIYIFSSQKNSFLSLYFKRKALEEQKNYQASNIA